MIGPGDLEQRQFDALVDLEKKRLAAASKESEAQFNELSLQFLVPLIKTAFSGLDEVSIEFASGMEPAFLTIIGHVKKAKVTRKAYTHKDKDGEIYAYESEEEIVTSLIKIKVGPSFNVVTDLPKLIQKVESHHNKISRENGEIDPMAFIDTSRRLSEYWSFLSQKLSEYAAKKKDVIAKFNGESNVTYTTLLSMGELAQQISKGFAEVSVKKSTDVVDAQPYMNLEWSLLERTLDKIVDKFLQKQQEVLSEDEIQAKKWKHAQELSDDEREKVRRVYIANLSELELEEKKLEYLRTSPKYKQLLGKSFVGEISSEDEDFLAAIALPDDVLRASIHLPKYRYKSEADFSKFVFRAVSLMSKNAQQSFLEKLHTQSVEVFLHRSESEIFKKAKLGWLPDQLQIDPKRDPVSLLRSQNIATSYISEVDLFFPRESKALYDVRNTIRRYKEQLANPYLFERKKITTDLVNTQKKLANMIFALVYSGKFFAYFPGQYSNANILDGYVNCVARSQIIHLLWKKFANEESLAVLLQKHIFSVVQLADGSMLSIDGRPAPYTDHSNDEAILGKHQELYFAAILHWKAFETKDFNEKRIFYQEAIKLCPTFQYRKIYAITLYNNPETKLEGTLMYEKLLKEYESDEEYFLEKIIKYYQEVESADSDNRLGMYLRKRVERTDTPDSVSLVEYANYLVDHQKFEEALSLYGKALVALDAEKKKYIEENKRKLRDPVKPFNPKYSKEIILELTNTAKNLQKDTTE